MERQSTLDLIARFSGQGDCAAAASLYERFADRLLALVRARLSDRFAARVGPEDVLQVAFNSFFRRLAAGCLSFARREDVWSVLRSITLHKLLKEVRRHKAGPRDVGLEQQQQHGNDGEANTGGLAEFAEACSREPSPEEAAAISEELVLAVRALNARDQFIIQARMEGVEDGDIAERADCSERTVRRVWDTFKADLERRLGTVGQGQEQEEA
jgi:RNA polymerase sigma-70 factor (ECF subfamily)